MIKPDRAAQLFLEGLNSRTTRDTFNRLSALVEALETKNDPDMVEVKLVDSIYSFMEKLQLLEGNLRTYTEEKRKNLPGSKLTELYENLTYNNGSGLFRD